MKNLDFNKIKQIAKDASGITNYTAGGDRAKYQGGKTALQAMLIVSSIVKGVAQNGIKVLDDAGKGMTDVQTFMPDGLNTSPVADAIQNATVNSKLLRQLDNKLITKNVENGQDVLVVVDKQRANSEVLKTISASVVGV